MLVLEFETSLAWCFVQAGTRRRIVFFFDEKGGGFVDIQLDSIVVKVHPRLKLFVCQMLIQNGISGKLGQFF